MRCYKCNGSMKEDVQLVKYRGRTAHQLINKCTKCDEGTVSLDEYERVRKELHPSIFERVKEFFRLDTKLVNVSKGKIL